MNTYGNLDSDSGAQELEEGVTVGFMWKQQNDDTQNEDKVNEISEIGKLSSVGGRTIDAGHIRPYHNVFRASLPQLLRADRMEMLAMVLEFGSRTASLCMMASGIHNRDHLLGKLANAIQCPHSYLQLLGADSSVDQFDGTF